MNIYLINENIYLSWIKVMNLVWALLCEHEYIYGGIPVIFSTFTLKIL